LESRQQPPVLLIVNSLLDRFYAALRSLSASDLAACVTDDFVLEWQGTPAIPWAGRWRGVEGLLAFIKTLNAEVEILDVQRLHEFGNSEITVVVLQGHWRIKSTHREVRAMAANLFTFSGGKVKSYAVLNNTAAFAEALSAAARAS
jgi:ketosteroid isomerase-like protein